jgi:hypothetical protein
LESTQPTYIQFNTPLASTTDGIFCHLNNALTSASIPPGSISLTIKFWAFPSIKIHDKKIAILTIHNPSLSMQIISVIQAAIPYSLSTTTDTLPHPPTINNIDATPYSTSFPLNCCIKTCPFYNGGASIFNNITNKLNIAQLHRTYLHHDFLTTLPTHILTSIGWTHCHATCNYFSHLPLTEINIANNATLTQLTTNPHHPHHNQDGHLFLLYVPSQDIQPLPSSS